MDVLLVCLAIGCAACLAYCFMPKKHKKKKHPFVQSTRTTPHPAPPLVSSNGTPTPEWHDTLFAALDHIYSGARTTTEQQLACIYQVHSEYIQATLARLSKGFEKVGTLHSSLAALERPDISLKELGDIVCRDPLLSSRILKTVNSPLFRTATNIKSIHTGINILGLNNLKNLIAYETMPYQLYKHPAHRHMFKEIWLHMNTTAIMASCMAKARQDIDSASLYTAGLMHDIGKLLLILLIRNGDDMPMFPYNLDNEYDRLGTTHLQAVKIMVPAGAMPDQLRFLLLNHHMPSVLPVNQLDCNAGQAKSLTLLFLANQIAKLVTIDGGLSEDIDTLDQLEPSYHDIIAKEEVQQIFLSPGLMRDILSNTKVVQAMLA